MSSFTSLTRFKGYFSFRFAALKGLGGSLEGDSFFAVESSHAPTVTALGVFASLLVLGLDPRCRIDTRGVGRVLSCENVGLHAAPGKNLIPRGGLAWGAVLVLTRLD